MKRVKFKVMYPIDYYDKSKAGKPYLPPTKHMVVMNGYGIFYLVGMEAFYPTVTKLSDVLPKYDIVWR